MPSNAFSFNFQYPLVSLRSYSSCLHLLPHHPITYIIPPMFTSITCFGRQFQHKTWPIQLTFLLFIICPIFLYSLTLQFFFISHMMGPTDLFHPSPAPHFRTLQVFIIYLNKVSKFQHCTKLCSKCSTALVPSLKFKSNLLVTRVFFLLNVALAMAILDLISCWHLLYI